MTSDPILQDLVDICGVRFARRAGSADAVAGAPASWIAAPATIDGAAAVLRLAAAHELAVVARGAGTKLDWGARPTKADLMIELSRLAGIWHHPLEESFVEIGAGTPVRAAQAMLRRVGQRLALDPPSAGASIGGMVAVDEAGPLAHRHGTVGDQLVGVSYLGPDGRLEHAAGSGTGRLLCGSVGALGVLVAATLRVQAEPAARAWVSRSVWTPLEVHDLVEVIVADPVPTAALEVDLPASRPTAVPQRRGRGTLAVLLEGSRDAVAERAGRVATLLGGDAQVRAGAPTWWGRYPFGPGDIAVRITVPTADLHAAVYALRDAAGQAVPVRGSAGVGVVHAALPGDLPPERMTAILDAVRGVLLARAGSCAVVVAPPAVREAVDLWGTMATPDVVRRIKARFDPDGRLAPGRFFGV
ncbi:FAD-binding oxidoreductase [Actinomycetes bacterium KLBMP 9797]